MALPRRRAEAVDDLRAAAFAGSMHRIRRAVAQPLVRPLAVVEDEVVGQPEQQFRQAGVAAQVDVFVLDRAPQPLDENVVQRPTAAVLG